MNKKRAELRRLTKKMFPQQNPQKVIFIKELPDWFDISNYKTSTKLDLKGWITQISLRTAVQNYGKKYFFTGIVDGINLPLTESIEHTPTGVYDKAKEPVQHITLDEAVWIVEVVKRLKIFPPDVWQSPNTYDSDEPNPNRIYRYFQTYKNQMGAIPKYLPYDPTIAEIIKVDLSVPDKILLKLFKEWLAEQRKGDITISKKTYTKSILRRWATNQVLPYIDLNYWATLNKVSIPHWLMAEALFPGEYQGDKIDRVRKTTLNNAEEIMEQECLYAMSAQFTHETNKIINTECIGQALFSEPGRVEINNCIFFSGKD